MPTEIIVSVVGAIVAILGAAAAAIRANAAQAANTQKTLNQAFLQERSERERIQSEWMTYRTKVEGQIQEQRELLLATQQRMTEAEEKARAEGLRAAEEAALHRSASLQLENASKSLIESQARLENARKQLEEFQAAHDADVKRYQDQIDGLMSTIGDLNIKVRMLNDQLGVEQAVIAELRHERDRLKQENADALQRERAAVKRAEDAELSIQQLKNEIQNLISRVRKLETTTGELQPIETP